MNDDATARLAADLRVSVGALVRATRTIDRLAPIPAAVLDLLELRGAMTTADLAASRGVRHQSMAATVKELIDAGLLATRADPGDARKKLLDLTAEGRQALDADRRGRVGLLARTLDEALDDEERRVLAQALHLIDRMTSTIAAATPSAGADRGFVAGFVTGAW